MPLSVGSQRCQLRSDAKTITQLSTLRKTRKYASDKDINKNKQDKKKTSPGAIEKGSKTHSKNEKPILGSFFT